MRLTWSAGKRCTPRHSNSRTCSSLNIAVLQVSSDRESKGPMLIRSLYLIQPRGDNAPFEQLDDIRRGPIAKRHPVIPPPPSFDGCDALDTLLLVWAACAGVPTAVDEGKI